MSLCTLTFLGQPRARISCVPISKHSVNMLDIPVISSFVQSAIDAAMAEYVAPKSLTLNLKDMLVGADFKKDTISRGVVWIYIKQARGFKQGDGGFGPIEGSSDSYVTCSWGKFGKPVASTRIIESSQEPNWHEFASILVTPEELNAEEKLRLQLFVTPLRSFCRLTDRRISHELYIYANTLDMYKNFAPKLNGRYLSSNVNITVADKHGNPVSVPVGGACPTCLASAQRSLVDTMQSGSRSSRLASE